MDRRTALRALAVVATAGAGCAGSDGPDGDGGGTPNGAGALGRAPSLTSSAFDDGDAVPVRHTCDGDDVSPPLAVGDVPAGADSLALVVDDPDAPGRTFTHWLLWGVPPTTRSVPEAVPTGGTVEDLGGAAQGTNDAGRVGYSGPCPPPDDGPHTYRFRLVALAEPLDLEPGADRSTVEAALEGVERSATVLRGTYDR